MVEWSGRTSSYNHKFDDWQSKPLEPNHRKAVRKQYILDAQWSDCPVEVETQVQDIWRLCELGNDNYIFKTSINNLLDTVEEGTTVDRWNDETHKWEEGPLMVDAIVQYLREQGIGDDEQIWIHWWW